MASPIPGSTPRRAFSMPATRATPSQDPQIEVLYTLPSARIVELKTSNPTSTRKSINGIVAADDIEPGSLSWRTRFERTIAMGALRIYRAPGSVAFLNCQSALRPILPKSQCWCVDGDSKFVLQIRPPQYWRIEVPNGTPDEMIRVEELKKVLGTVLRFEQTPCPFKRDFCVELPEPPITPIKKKPWKPVERRKLDPSPLSDSPLSESPLLKALASDIQTPDDGSVVSQDSPCSRMRVDSLITAIEEQSQHLEATESQNTPTFAQASPESTAQVETCSSAGSVVLCENLAGLENHTPSKTISAAEPLECQDTLNLSQISDSTTSSLAEIFGSPQTFDSSDDFEAPGSSQAPEAPKDAPSMESSDRLPLTEILDTPKPIDDISTFESLEAVDYPPKDLAHDDSILSEISELSLIKLPATDLLDVASPGPRDDSDNFSDATDDTGATPTTHVSPFVDAESLSKPLALQKSSRSITAPPVLSLITSPPSKKYREHSVSPVTSSTISESSAELSSSSESFHSVQSWHSPLAPPSPPASIPSSPVTYPYPHENIVLPKRSRHSRDVSELTAIPKTPGVWDEAPDVESDMTSLSPSPRTPTLIEDRSDKSDGDRSEVFTPPTATTTTIRHRTTTSSNSRRRELSPLPPAVNLFSPRRKRRPRRLKTARHLPTAIIQKTFEILISPPSHLFQLMLNIASKIAAGEWRGMLPGSGDGDAVYWDFEDEYGGNAWFEDDYGISLAKPISNTKRPSRSSAPGGSWEVD